MCVVLSVVWRGVRKVPVWVMMLVLLAVLVRCLISVSLTMIVLVKVVTVVSRVGLPMLKLIVSGMVAVVCSLWTCDLMLLSATRLVLATLVNDMQQRKFEVVLVMCVSCVVCAAGVVTKTLVSFVCVRSLCSGFVLLTGVLIVSMLLMLVVWVLLVKCLMLRTLTGPRQFTSMIGAVVLCLWNLCITVSMWCSLIFPLSVCLSVCRTIGLLVTGLENGMLSLTRLVLVLISVRRAVMAYVGLGLFVARNGTSFV